MIIDVENQKSGSEENAGVRIMVCFYQEAVTRGLQMCSAIILWF